MNPALEADYSAALDRSELCAFCNERHLVRWPDGSLECFGGCLHRWTSERAYAEQIESACLEALQSEREFFRMILETPAAEGLAFKMSLGLLKRGVDPEVALTLVRTLNQAQARPALDAAVQQKFLEAAAVAGRGA